MAILVMLATALWCLDARAADEDNEPIQHTLILGVGGAEETELRTGDVHAGANVMVEWDAVEPAGRISAFG